MRSPCQWMPPIAGRLPAERKQEGPDDVSSPFRGASITAVAYTHTPVVEGGQQEVEAAPNFRRPLPPAAPLANAGEG